MASMNISANYAGWATLTIYDNNHIIHGISYINPYIVEDLCSWLIALKNNKPYTLFLDQEGNGVYLTCHQRDIIITPLDGKPEFVFYVTDDELQDMIKNFESSAREQIDVFVSWLEDDVTDTKTIESYLNQQLNKLTNEG